MKMKVFSVLIVLFSVSLISLSAQWARTYGGAGSDVAYSIQQTSEGGYIAAGNTENTFWVVKTDPKGRVEWERSYDPSVPNSIFPPIDKKAKCIQQTNDGGYIIAGMILTTSFNGFNYTGMKQIYILKLSSEGAMEWNRILDGAVYSDKAFTIQQTKDGEYIVATDIYGSWLLSPIPANYRIIKLGTDGSIKWYGCFIADKEYDSPHAVRQTSDGGYIVAGETFSTISYSRDFLIIKFDSTGVIEWQKKYGGSSNEEANSIQQTSDGGYIVAGSAESFGAGGRDFWILRINAAGNVIWQRAYGGTSNDDLNSLRQTSDGGYIVAGSTESFGAGGQDVWILKLDADGAFVWQKTFGGKKNDAAYSIQQTKDGGYIAAGSTESYGAGKEDFLILKLDQNGDIDSSSPFQGNSTAGFSVTSIIPENASLRSFDWPFGATTSLNTVKNTQAVVKLICSVSPVSILSLSSNHLSFAAFSNGDATQAQSFLIKNNGNGTMTWNINDNAGWLTCSPTSGTGNGKAMVSVNPAGSLLGKYTSEITVSSPEAENSPQVIETTLSVMNLADCRPPFGYFETPANDAQGVTGAIPVTGWVIDDIETTKVEIKRDPVAADPAEAIGSDGLVFIGDGIFVEGARPDVEAAYPTYPLNSRAGWGYMLLTNFLPNQGNGTYKLHTYASDKEGNRVLLGTKTITCDNAHATKPFGTIDTPTQGGDASGTTFVNFGWVLTPMPKTVPKDGSTILVWVDGVQVGDLKTAPNVYNQYRVDVATAFPGLNNSAGPVGAFYLDTTNYPNGIHIISWVATDDGGAADGIGSRYFNIMNTGTSGQESTEAQATASGPPSSFETITQIPISNESLAELPVSFSPVWVKRGFDRDRPAEMITPDNYGLSRIEIEEVSPIEIDLAGSFNNFLSSSAARSNENPASRPAPPNIARYRGFQLVGTELRPLPVGSTLDTATGTFSWLPGPGFIGSYNLVFIREENGVSRATKIIVDIRPNKYQNEGAKTDKS